MLGLNCRLRVDVCWRSGFFRRIEPELAHARSFADTLLDVHHFCLDQVQLGAADYGERARFVADALRKRAAGDGERAGFEETR